ncbi:MAG: LPS export ABC transporter periplasmic protein LptC [Alphaproteobacteria bacterium]|nr:LPS export ABC transporter periplasmic protein LptC [Alphaproteobacteria bacterium]
MPSQAKALEQPSRLPSSAAPISGRNASLRASAITDRYSRRVQFLKRILPAVGVALLLLVGFWPKLHPMLQQVRLGFAIDLREARELRMVNPRYAGLDRYNRPYVVTAAVGRQVPDRNDVMALEQPKAVMTVHGGASVVVTAATGIYQSQAQLLDLFDDVNLIHENGTRFVTRRAHANLSDDTAEGHDPIEGHGPSGDIAGEGFQVASKGETIVFTGKSNVLLKGSKPNPTPASPPGLPPEIEQTAAQIESIAPAIVAADASLPADTSNPEPPGPEPGLSSDAPTKPMPAVSPQGVFPESGKRP